MSNEEIVEILKKARESELIGSVSWVRLLIDYIPIDDKSTYAPKWEVILVLNELEKDERIWHSCITFMRRSQKSNIDRTIARLSKEK